MKTLKSFLLVVGIALVTLTFSSCVEDDNSYSLDDMWVAIATVVPQGNDSYYLRLDNGDTLWPAASNYPGYPAKAGQRAFINFTILSDSAQGFSHFVKVNAIHDVLTKAIAKNEGAKNDSIYGTNAVSILSDKDIWVGDGYLNMYFVMNAGGQKPHFINLIQADAEKNPYELEFKHNAFDDPSVFSTAGRVAFNLASLPDTKGETVELKVKVKTFEGDKVYSVKYNTDKTKHATVSADLSDKSVTNMESIK